MKKINYDQNEEFLHELKNLLKKYKVRFCGNMSERPYITFQDRTQYYFEYNEEEGLEVAEYKSRNI